MRTTRRRSVVAAGGALLIAVLGAGALAVDGIADARDTLDSRFAARAEVSASFIGAMTSDIFDREATAAELHLTEASPSAADVELAAAGQRMDAAVLMDDDGRVIATYPARPDLIGVDLARLYDHLASAVAGRPTVSIVVPSAAKGVPVVGFALPFDTPSGRRVFSGALDVRDTPLGQFLANASPLGGYHAYLVDREGQIVASATGTIGALATVEPELAAAIDDGREGSFDQNGDEQHFVSRTIEGAPWTLVTALPTDVLHQPLYGVQRSTYLVGAVLLLMAVWVIRLLFLATVRSRMLAQVASTDPLTGAGNRRGLDSWVLEADPATPIGAVVLDIDHFKSVNDRWGHAVGDQVLRAVGDRLRHGVREGDQVVRWGGEEFAVVLAGADRPTTIRTAERLRAAVARPIGTDAGPISLTASFGVAVGTVGTIGADMDRADDALYEAKRAGRNIVVTDDHVVELRDEVART